MSSSKQLIINCGASHITAASAESVSGNLELERLVSLPLKYDYTDDEGWLDAVRDGLRELTQRHKFAGKATIIIPGNQVLTKTIRIPHVEESKRAQILAFEAQQNIPYPLHEVVWDSQVVGDDGVETEILFIACKSNTIDEICESITSAGLTPEKINAATILEFNALEFSYAGAEEDLLLINIGARSTNLLFKNADGFFVRNIQLGGNTLTQSIADSLGKSFPQAEELKSKFFNGELDYGNENSGAKLLQGAADGFIRRVSQEVTRSIVNYRRQKKGAAPQRILLTGRGSQLKGLAEKLAESQKTPVDFFDPLQGVSLGEQITSDAEVLRLETTEIIGEACAGQVASPAGVNLLPDDLQQEMAFNAKKPFLMIAAVCLALAPWPAFLAYQQKAAAYQAEARALEKEAMPLQGWQNEIFETAEKAQAVSAQIAQVIELINSKSNWIQFFAELQSSLMQAEDVWLDNLSVVREDEDNGKETTDAGTEEKETYEIVLTGKMLVRDSANGGEVGRDVLTNRINFLNSSFETSEFVDSSRLTKINWESLNSGLNVLPFTINLVVDTSKKL